MEALATQPATPLDPPKLKVINLWAGPGAGKSTLAAAIFNLMKRERFEVELVTEVAKGLTYDKAFSELSNQTMVLAKQEHQLRRLIGQVEYAIVDSPFPMGLVYSKQPDRLEHLIDALWDDYTNFNFFVTRTKRAYQTFGRNETLEEARKLDERIWSLAVDFGDEFLKVVDPDEPTSEYLIVNEVLEAQGEKTLTERLTEVVP